MAARTDVTEALVVTPVDVDNVVVMLRRELDIGTTTFKDSLAQFRTYVDSLHDADLRALSAALASMEKRLDGMNEFRTQLSDQAANFFTREAFEVFRTEVDRRINELRELEALHVTRAEFVKIAEMVQGGVFVTADKYDTESRAGSDAIAAIGREVDRRLTDSEKKQANTDGKMAVYAVVGGLIASGITTALITRFG